MSEPEDGKRSDREAADSGKLEEPVKPRPPGRVVPWGSDFFDKLKARLRQRASKPKK
jgi:hypothetical protein